MTLAHPLTGQRLLNKIAKMKTASRREIAIACGYGRVRKNGIQHVNLIAYYEAILIASGLMPSHRRRPGKPRSYLATVDKFGTVAIRLAYTKEAGLNFGDTVRIAVSDEHITIYRCGHQIPRNAAAAVVEGEVCPF